MIKKILLFLFFFTVNNLLYSQTSQILIETTLTKYSNDVKTNTYQLNLSATGMTSRSFSYGISNNDDNEKYFYDLITLDKSNYPVNYTATAFNRVKPTIMGGPECSETSQGHFTSQQSPALYLCHAVSRFLVLDLPIPETPVGNCERISIDKYVNIQNASYSWQYRKSIDTQWSDFNYGTHYTFNGLSFIPKELPGLSTYTGNIMIRFVVSYENLKTGKIVSYSSNLSTYAITDCSPQYIGGTPPTTDVTCNNQSDGSVTLKFKPEPELIDGDVFLFNIFHNTSPPEFINSKKVPKDSISDNTYIWKNLARGDYIIKYQTQRSTDPTEKITGLSVVEIPPFEIKEPTALKFEAKAVQTECNEIKIEISASGGTKPYFYYLDNETIKDKHPFTSPYIIPDKLPDGNYKVTVVDSRECIEKPEL